MRYFSRLLNIDRKKWIAEEHYRRNNLNISTISDKTFDALRMTPGKRY